MNQKELKELIEFLIEKDVAEFEYERGDVKVRVVRQSRAAPQPQAIAHSAPAVHASAPALAPTAPHAAAAAPATAAPDADIQIVKSPIVGTFYECPSPGTPPFVKEGDRISVGQVLCIVEAMKLMNEIESDFAGTIVKRLVSNGQPVEYGQQLFTIRKD
ncbi:MAG: acetyl-CoA carboxylase biotin carboxyl carrier protein [Acidobacteriaceae bacterium]